MSKQFHYVVYFDTESKQWMADETINYLPDGEVYMPDKEPEEYGWRLLEDDELDEYQSRQEDLINAANSLKGRTP